MKQYFGYFTDEKITVPTEVKNAIEDVFLENDNIEGVECYHKEDLEQFQQDLTITNFVNMRIDGKNEGSTKNIWTYYGNISYSFSEVVLLVDENENVLEEISRIENDEISHLETTNDYAVVLLENVNWESESKTITRELNLYIYCPVPLENEEDKKYYDIYNQLKDEEVMSDGE